MEKKIIVGAGPAGLSAAITLAQAGYPVEVYEMRDDVGKRFHEDLQGLENWTGDDDIVKHLADRNISCNFDCTPFSQFTITTGREQVVAQSNRPFFYLVKRGAAKGSFDYGLKEQALAAGVMIRFRASYPQEDADIIATGPLAKSVCCIAKGIVFDTSHENCAYAMINDKAAKRGYSYLLVSGGYGCMCTVVFDDFFAIDSYFGTTRNLFQQRYSVDIHHPRPVGGVGNLAMPGRFRLGDKPVVGEAAGIQDFLWGFGMKTAIESGYLAARSIIEGYEYETAARNAFRNYLRAGQVNRFLWEKGKNLRYSLLSRGCGSAQKLLPTLRSFYEYNFFQRIIYPFAALWGKRRYPQVWE